MRELVGILHLGSHRCAMAQDEMIKHIYMCVLPAIITFILLCWATGHLTARCNNTAYGNTICAVMLY